MPASFPASGMPASQLPNSDVLQVPVQVSVLPVSRHGPHRGNSVPLQVCMPEAQQARVAPGLSQLDASARDASELNGVRVGELGLAMPAVIAPDNGPFVASLGADGAEFACDNVSV